MRQELTQAEYESLDGRKFFEEHGHYPHRVPGTYTIEYPNACGENAARPLTDHAKTPVAKPSEEYERVKAGTDNDADALALLRYYVQAGILCKP